ncbi:MAG: hypothetical protein Q9170_004512 [Blastenia crenularia]
MAIDKWCGKAYKQGDPPVVPDGMISPPTISPVLLIDVAVRPRMNLYLDGESEASFIVDTTASYIHGQPYNNPNSASSDHTELRARSNLTVNSGADDRLNVRILHTDTGRAIIPQAGIAFNTTSRDYSITLASFKPRQAPWPITLELTKKDGTKFTATTELRYLPNPQAPQSITRIDSLTGGLQVRSNGPSWEPFFPYSFYLGGPWLEEDRGNLKKFKDLGYNVLHIVPGGEGIGYDLRQLDAWFDEAQQLGLWIMFDMRWTYQNTEYVRTQVDRYKKRKNMLLWYTADEPDGHEDPPSAPSKSYNFIKQLDPYHPISLCLNCQNYYFQEYSSGADIIMADTYPIGTNTEYSTKYHTPCNTTYGDCGCDNCHTSPISPPLSNIPSRLTLWNQFQTQLGLPRKPLWSVPQAFTAQDFWTRTPTIREVIAMTMLSVNHGATGIVMWVFPTAEELIFITSQFSKWMTSPQVIKFLLEVQWQKVGVTIDGGGQGEQTVDASMWRRYGQCLVSVVNMGEEATRGDVRLELPGDVKVKGEGTVFWSGGGWKVEGEKTLIEMSHPIPPPPILAPSRSTTAPTSQQPQPQHHHHIHRPHRSHHHHHHHHRDKSVPQSAILPTTSNPFKDNSFGDLLSPIAKVGSRLDYYGRHEREKEDVERKVAEDEETVRRRENAREEKERHTWREVEKRKRARVEGEKDLNKKLTTLSTLSTATTRRLDYTHYSLLSHLSSLVSTLSALSSLSSSTSSHLESFENSINECTRSTQGQIKQITTQKFAGQNDRAEALKARVKGVRDRVEMLEGRLNGVREKIEREERGEREKGRRRDWRWKCTAGFLMGLLGVLALGAMLRSGAREGQGVRIKIIGETTIGGYSEYGLQEIGNGTTTAPTSEGLKRENYKAPTTRTPRIHDVDGWEPRLRMLDEL